MPGVMDENEEKKHKNKNTVNGSNLLRPRAFRLYEFDGHSFLHMYLHYPEFKSSVDSGKYVFVDGKVVLKSKNCLRVENGRLKTIDFSDNELSEYCLSLVYIRIPIVKAPRRIPGVNHRPFTNYKREIHIVEAQKVSLLKDITKDNLFEVIGGGPEPPNSFGKALIHFMSARGVTIEQLAGETGLSPKTIQRMRNTPNIIPELKSVVAVCIGLHLDPYESDMLLHLAGYNLTDRKIDCIYRFFLNVVYKESVEDCNEMLVRVGMDPLIKRRE